MENKDLYKKIRERMGMEEPYLDDLIGRGSGEDAMSVSRRTRDALESTLGNSVLKDTGYSVPNIKNASRSEMESFLNKINEERYPELKTPIELRSNLGNNLGAYYGDDNVIKLAHRKNMPLEELVGTMLHESGHAYDDLQGLGQSAPDSLKTKNKAMLERVIKEGQGLEDLLEADAFDINEIKQAGHHAEIPKLRQGKSYGSGALKSLIKNKAFRAIPLVGPLAAALYSGEASAALPVDVEGAGPEAGSLDYKLETGEELTPEEKTEIYRRLSTKDQ